MADGRRSRVRIRLRRRRRLAAEQRNWAELPRDVLFLIFQKLGAIEVLWTAQAVCRPWRQVALEPQLWRCIDMRYHADLCDMVDMEELAREAVDRSGGLVERFYAEYFGSDDLLLYIADRTSGLRCLVLISVEDVSEEGLVEFVRRCPLLEELQITNCWFSEEAYGAIGRVRPELKCFRLNTSYSDDDNDKEALEIANNMPQLRELQLIGNQITYKGVEAILDKCPHLESLDIRACINVNVDAGLWERLARMKNVRLPHDSTSDYEYETGISEDGGFGYGNMFAFDSNFRFDDADYFNDYDDDGFLYYLM